MRDTRAQGLRNIANWCDEEAAKPNPSSWSADYAQGFNDALAEVAEWCEGVADELDPRPAVFRPDRNENQP